MHYSYIIIALLAFNFFSVSQVNAQIKVTNSDGEKIILMPDGTWVYADQDKQANAPEAIKNQQKEGKVKVNKKKLSKEQKKELKKIEKAQKRRENIRKKLAKQEENKRKKEEKKRLAEEKKRLEQEKKAKRLADKKAKKDKAKAKKNKKTSSRQSKNLTKAKKSKKNKKSKINADPTAKKTSKKVPSKRQQAKLIKQQFKPFKIVKIVKPQQECSYAMNEVDKFTKKRKVATKPSFFFGYTHPKLEKYLKGDHYLVCNGHMSEVAGLTTLHLKFTFDSESAQDDYGSILQGSRMLISLLDGTTVTLVAGEADGGKIDRNKKQTIYKTYFVIDSRSQKKLKKSEINQVRMVWGEGFEDYDITEVDFIINQLTCLNNAISKK
jgi:chemotaxis protein histidine kinase CheA